MRPPFPGMDPWLEDLKLWLDLHNSLITAIRDDNPVIMIEHRMLHNVKGVVPTESYEIPYGKARVLSPGKDITIVGISHMALECVRAMHLLEDAGIDEIGRAHV